MERGLRRHLSFEQVAQGLHISIGVLFMLVPRVWNFTNARTIGLTACVAYGLVKEFVYDLRYEDLETSGGLIGSSKDFFFYIVGMLVGLLILAF